MTYGNDEPLRDKCARLQRELDETRTALLKALNQFGNHQWPSSFAPGLPYYPPPITPHFDTVPPSTITPCWPQHGSFVVWSESLN